MRYICEMDHKFTHTAKRIFVDDATTDKYEIPVCPLCYTPVYDEYILGDKKITSVVSVDLFEVDARLAEGYTVESLYAKTATLVKRE